MDGRAVLKTFFLTGEKPTQDQFADLIDSCLNLVDDTISISMVSGLASALAAKASAFTGTSAQYTKGDGTYTTLGAGDVTGALGFTPENVANKSTSTTLGMSDTLYPSQNAVKTYVDTAVAGLTVGSGPVAWTSITGTPATLAGYGITDGLTAAVAAASYQPIGSYLTAVTSAEVIAALGFTPYNITNPAGYITGITGSMVSTALGYTPQTALSGNGFVKITGTTVSYDASTYLTTSSAASTYAPLNSPAFTGSPSLTLGSDAPGDIYYRNASGSLARLGIGSSGQLLTVSAGLPSWQNPGGGVTGLSNTDGTLTFSAATGNIVGSLNLAHANTWTAAQTINSSGYQLTLQDTGGHYVQMQAWNGGLIFSYPASTQSITNQGSFTNNGAFYSGSGMFAVGIQTSISTVLGSTSGSCQFYQLTNGPGGKLIMICSTNLTGTASFTFPNAFIYPPAIISTSGTNAITSSQITSLSVSSVTVTGSATSGVVMLCGL